MVWSRSKAVLVVAAAATVIWLIALIFRVDQVPRVANLNPVDVIKINQVVRHRQWEEVLPDHSWKSLRAFPGKLLLFCTSRHRVCAVSLDGDSVGVATWHGADPGSALIDIDWLEKHDGHWKTVRRTRNVRRYGSLTVTNPPPLVDPIR